MNCEAIQNKVLALPDPRQVPPNLREHLDGCPACRAWWQQAVRLERLIERLPAPPAPADKKAALIDELTAAGPVIKTIPSVARLAGPSRLAELLRTRSAKYVAAIAAAILVVIGGWQLIKPTKGPDTFATVPQKHPLLEKVVQRITAQARPQNTPAQRLEILGELADDVSAESRSLARVGTYDDLNQIAEWFIVVNAGIEDQARNLPPGMNPTEKRELLNRLSARLAAAGQQVNQVKGESPEQSKPALQKIVDAAQDGQKKLQTILGET